MNWLVLAVGIGILIVGVSGTSQEEDEDEDQLTESSIARPQWQDVNRHSDASKEPDEKEFADGAEGDSVQQRRPRPRPGGKRRRRLRKRPRTTTEVATEEEASDNVEIEHSRWQQDDRTQSDHSIDAEVVKPRRRPGGKRRRRPYRKQQPIDDEDQETQEQNEEVRKRRKGTRKRIRVQEDYNTTPLPSNEKNREDHYHTLGSQINQQYVGSDSRVEEVTDRQYNTLQPQGFSHTVKYLPVTNSKLLNSKEVNKQNEQTESLQEEKTEDTKKESDTDKPNKTFNRKALFSTSRRLPPTSAVIRRRLKPKENESDTIEKDPNGKVNNLLPKGYKEQQPEIIPPKQLIEEIMSKTSTTVSDTEEPNYPKPGLRTPPALRTTAKPKLDFMVDDIYKIGKEPETTTVKTKPIEEAVDDEDENLDVSNVEDHILDLLMTENGSSRLAKILELRNMTLIQLIQHRERGSSQLHLSDIFNKNGQLKTEEEMRIAMENRKKLDRHNDTAPESRVPRIFESMPNFNEDTIPEAKSPPNPSWRVIPNPKLTPVSPHGVYREIQLAKTTTTKRPYHVDNIEDIILLEDNDTNHGYSLSGFNTEFTNRLSDSFTTFKKFPPGVKSAIIVSAGILVLAIIGFLSVLISCRVRQKRSRMRAKQDVLCEQLHNEDFMNSQRSLSPVLNKNQQPGPVFSQGIHSNTTSNRHYYLWRTLRKTFQYD